MGGPGGSSYTYSIRRGDQVRWYTNHGGSRGPSGSHGARGQYAPPGRDGLDGTFSIVVPDGASIVSYSSIFNLRLLGFEIAPEKEDGIIEPGSRVLVSSIEIKNVGGMPTPTGRSVLAYIKPEEYKQPTLNGQNWVVSEGYNRFVQLPQALGRGDTVVMPCASWSRKFDGRIRGAINPEGEHLAFYVAPIDPVLALSSLTDRHQRGEPFKVTTRLTIRAQMTPFGRDFATFVNPLPFLVSYPIQMSTIASLPCLPPGGETFIKLSISNVSLKQYGVNGDMGRKVMVKTAYEGGSLDASKLTFIQIIDGKSMSPIVFTHSASNTQSPPYEGQIVWPILRLLPSEKIELLGRLSISEDVVPYTKAHFSVDLLLGEIEDPHNVVAIQRRQMSVCASKLYKKTPNSATLLVVNQQTTDAELKAWEELAAFIFGATNPSSIVDIWDVSQEGDFDLKRTLKGGSTLCNDWEGSTVVILDNHFDNSATRTPIDPSDDRALNYLNQDDLVDAAASHDINFCIVSPLPENSAAQRQHLSVPEKGIHFASSMAFETLRELLDPFAIEPTSFVVYGSSKDFIAAEINLNVDGTPMPRKFTLPWSVKPRPPIHDTNLSLTRVYTHTEHIILVKRSRPFKSLRKVTKLAAELQRALLRKHPERRYAIATCHVGDLGELMNQANFVLPPQTQAAIRLHRSLDVSSLTTCISLTAAPASPVDTMALPPGSTTIHTPAFIKSPQITSAFLQSITFRSRIALYVEVLHKLDFALANDERRAGLLRASLLADLACEQEVLRMKKRNHGLTEGSVTLLLPRLGAFCQIDLPPMPLESAGRHHLLVLLANLKAYMMTKDSWYTIFVPGYRSRRITKMSNLLIDDLVSRVFSTGATANKYVVAASSKTLKQWNKDFRAMRESLRKGGRSDQLVSLKGRALAAVLGDVAGGKIEWCVEPPHLATSIAGCVCTIFSIFFTPSASNHPGSSGHPTRAEASSNASMLGSIAPNRDAELITRRSTMRRDSIASKRNANRRRTRELSFVSTEPPVYDKTGD
jgi:hypothetical protein